MQNPLDLLGSKPRRVAGVGVCAAACLTLMSLSGLARVRPAADTQTRDDNQWTRHFSEAASDFASTGRNPYFVLEPGYVLTFQGTEEGVKADLTITVLGETLMVDGVETRVVEERESHEGKLVEVSRNYFAISKRTNNVYYFGEDTDTYENGAVVNHEGSWRSGSGGATYGLAVPATAMVGARFYQEVSPNVAMDRVEIVSTSETASVPAGQFKDCVKTEETTPLEPGEKEYKVYASGVGLVIDGTLKLVKHGFLKK